MTLGAVASYRKRPLAIVAKPAGFSVFHLLHGDFFMFFAVNEKFIVTVVAGKLHAIHMGGVAENHIATLVLQSNVFASPGKNRH